MTLLCRIHILFNSTWKQGVTLSHHLIYKPRKFDISRRCRADRLFCTDVKQRNLYDVVICGGGMVGAALACSLGKMGLLKVQNGA